MDLDELRNIVRTLASEVIEEGKKKKSSVNPAYLKGLGGAAREERADAFERRAKEPHDDPRSYRPFKTDKDPRTGKLRKTKPSKWNVKFQQMFGEDLDFSWDELLEAEMDILEGSLSESKKRGSSVTTALKKKAKKANAPLGALRAIYNKGLAAWRTGHRPGASQAAWAMARVNSVLAGGPARKVDAAQWQQIKKFRARKRAQ